MTMGALRRRWPGSVVDLRGIDPESTTNTVICSTPSTVSTRSRATSGKGRNRDYYRSETHLARV
jgi:hypothetical protein